LDISLGLSAALGPHHALAYHRRRPAAIAGGPPAIRNLESLMRLVMLARNAALYSHQRIAQAARSRGHKIDVINTLHVHMNITSNRPTLHYGGRTLPIYDAVIPRIGASVTNYGLAVLRQFEVQGVFPLNESVAIGRSRDKLRALQLLARKGIGLPVTAFAHGPRKAEAVLKEVGGAPVVIKLLEGTQGMGVILAETDASAKSIIEAFSAANVNVIVQEFIEEAGGADVRALVVGGRVVAAMMRTGKKGDFRSNLHRGGKGTAIEISPKERETAVRSAEILGLNVCGVDMLRSARGPVVMEVNSSPGLEGIEQATKVDVAGEIIDFLEAHARRGATETRGHG
jgi:ribosomal protein S6--L-glutamate ligase